MLKQRIEDEWSKNGRGKGYPHPPTPCDRKY